MAKDKTIALRERKDGVTMARRERKERRKRNLMVSKNDQLLIRP